MNNFFYVKVANAENSALKCGDECNFEHPKNLTNLGFKAEVKQKVFLMLYKIGEVFLKSFDAMYRAFFPMDYLKEEAEARDRDEKRKRDIEELVDLESRVVHVPFGISQSTIDAVMKKIREQVDMVRKS